LSYDILRSVLKYKNRL